MMSESRSDRSSISVFVGREREMAGLRTALDDAMSGQSRVAMLAGEPGIGKTRTAQELVSHAQSVGAQTFWGWCYEQEGAPPYWPWIQPIRAFVQQADADLLRTLMGSGAANISEIIPEVGEKLPGLQPPPPLEPAQARFRLFESTATFLKNLAKTQPLLIVLDDLQWADQPSLLLLEFLARQIPDSRFMLLGTYRDTEVSSTHPLSNTLATLARSDAYRRQALGGLEGEHVGQLIQAVSGTKPTPQLILAIYGPTEGNPFFMTEVIRLLAEQRQVSSDTEGDSPAELEIPQSVLEVIGQRLSRLSQECQTILSTAAVIGRQIDFRLLNILNPEASEIQLLELVEEALESHILQDVPGQRDQYQFSHALVQQTLLERISSSQVIRLHATIAEALELLHGTEAEAHASEMAHHFAEAQTVLGTEKLVHYSLLAGQKALATYAYEEGLNHFEKGLLAKGITITSSQAAPDGEAAALFFGLGRAQLVTAERHRLIEGVACLSRAFDYYTETGEVDRAVSVAQSPMPMTTAFLAGAAELNRRALELVQRGSHDEGLLLSQHARTVYFMENDYESARDAYTQALAIANREHDTDLELRTLGIAAHVDAFNGKYYDSLEKSLRGLELARRIDSPQAESTLQFWTAGMRLVTGDLQGAKPHLGSMRDLAKRFGGRYWLTSSFWQSALVCYYEGDWEAMRYFSNQALEESPHDGRNLVLRIHLESELGNFAEAEIYLERLFETIRLERPSPDFSYMLPALGLPLASRISGDIRHFEAAETIANAVLTAPNASRYVAWGASAGLGLIAVQRGDSVAASDCYSLLASNRGSAYVGLPLVLDRLLGLLAQTMGNPSLAAEHFEDALTFCRKGGYRPELAWTCSDYAETLLHHNEESKRAKALALLDESLAISTELTMRSLMQRVSGIKERAESEPVRSPAYPDGLTQREVEVLRLVYQGKTDREIAEELIIGVRTAQSHVSNILNKTAAANRTEAASYAKAQGLV